MQKALDVSQSYMFLYQAAYSKQERKRQMQRYALYST